LNNFIKDKYVEKKWARKKKEHPASLIAQGKALEKEEEEVVKAEEEESQSPKDKHSSHSGNSQQPKFQKLNFNNGEKKKEKDNNSTNGGKSTSLIEFQENGSGNGKKVTKIDFNDFEEAPTQNSSNGTTSSNFAFINKPNGNVNNASSLIDLSSSENLKDVKFKEASDNIFKLFTQGELPVSNTPKQVVPEYSNGYPQHNNNPISSYPQMNNIYNNNYQYNGGYNNGYSNGGNGYNSNNNNNLYRNNYSYPMGVNSNLHSSDLFNKNNTYETTTKTNSSFNINNVDMTTMKVQANKEKNADPFKNLVNFK